MAQENLHRTVFCTYLNPEKDRWEDYSSIQFGYQSSSQVHAIAYRVLGGEIYDISSFVQVTASSGNENFHIVLPAGKVQGILESVTELKLGFDIQVQKFGSENTTFVGTNNGLPWKGSYIGKDETPMDVIQAGKRDIDTDVKQFLDITPLQGSGENLADQARVWSKDIFQDLMTQCFSDAAKSNFLKDLKGIGDAFAEKDLPSKTLPEILKVDGTPLQLKKIQADNLRMFYVSGIHEITHNLSHAGWLDSDYRDRIVDKREPYWIALSCGEEELAKRLSEYGNELEAGKEAGVLRAQYNDAVDRCYCAAYVCLCPGLEKYFSAAEDMFNRTRDIVLSDNYKSHWLPLTVDATSNNRAELMKMHLALLHDKLALLLLIANKYKGAWQGQIPQVDEIIHQLAEAAKNTGFYGTTNMQLSSLVFSLNLGEIFSEDTLLQFQMVANQEIGLAGGDVMAIPMDYRSITADAWLSKEAEPLGLYREKSGSCEIM